VQAFVFLREFVLGRNDTGLVKGKSVVGGENPDLAEFIQSGSAPIYTGAGTTEGSYVAPTATIASWDRFIATATAEHGRGPYSG